jgi:hypothetical protein
MAAKGPGSGGNLTSITGDHRSASERVHRGATLDRLPAEALASLDALRIVDRPALPAG